MSGSRGDETDEIDDEVDDRPPRARRAKKRKATAPLGRRARILRVVKWVALGGAGLGVLGVLTLVVLFLYYGSDPKLPNIQKLADYRPPQLTLVLDRHDKLLGTLAGSWRRRVITYDKLPKHFVDAVVAAEDPTFWQNSGLDYRGFLRAFVDSVMRGRIGPGRWGQGGSTITQQVVKGLLLSPEKTPRRKAQEMILARRLTKQLSKEEILTIYLNDIAYGDGRYGCEEAARYFFGKSIAEVDIGEAAFLAGAPQRPERHSPHRNPEGAKNRQLYVLRQMVEHGYLDRAKADEVAKKPIAVQPPSAAESGQAPEVLSTVYRAMVEKLGAAAIPTLGATVHTTVDLGLQTLAREALERGLENLDQRQGYRGPTGHLEGAALEQYRYELRIARQGPRPEELVEGRAGNNDPKQRRLKRPLRHGLPKLTDATIFEGVVDRLEPAAKPHGRGRILIDIGGKQGVVDLAREERYLRGGKPLTDKLKPGDLLRVRLAPERRRVGAAPDAAEAEPPLALELGPQAALVVLDPRSHEVLALVGGYDFHAGGFDRTQRALRQPGSSFKPFVYAAAIESGRYTAASLVNDAPEVYELWKPQNYEREAFRGPVRLRTALAESINTVSIRLVADVGVPAVSELAARAGITTPIDPNVGLSLALGANSVTPLELANAYATFASGGQRAPYRLIVGVDGQPPEAVTAPVAALKPELAYVVTSLMRSVVEEGTARAAAAKLKRPLAGKTGTSSGQRDAWFVGFAPDLLAAVWVGFDDYRTLGKGEAGGRTAVPIWADFMGKALANRPVEDFAPPPAITVARIDPATGMLAAPGADGLEEVFLEGTAPKESSAPQDDAANADRLLLQRTP